MEAAREYIRERITVEDHGYATACWVWLRCISSTGYGKGCFGGRKDILAHRLSYEAFVGPIPAGLQIDHLCRNRACVNPSHLEPVTSGENTRRGLGPALVRERCASITHCRRGHAFTPENTRRNNRQRVCVTCARANNASYKRRQKLKVRELATGGERFAGGRAAKATRRITRTQDHGLALHDVGAPTP